MVDYRPLYPSGVFLVGKSLGVRGANGGRTISPITLYSKPIYICWLNHKRTRDRKVGSARKAWIQFISTAAKLCGRGKNRKIKKPLEKALKGIIIFDYK